MKRLTTLILCLVLLASLTAPAAAEPIKYALSMFHFNVQYVAGGLEGFIPNPLPPYPTWELNAIQTEDMIVTESFEPVVDLFLEHPDWTVTLEMQGYFLDVLAERHPDVLDKLRDLADAGGAELVSFHYSDQLFLAYPYEDWRRSMELTKETFDKYDMPLSGTVFCQEGQSGPGLASAMENNGYAVMAWPKNLWKYQFGEITAAPYYNFGNLKMTITGESVSDDFREVYTTWTFFGDGELLATGDLDPYFPWFFKERDWAIEEYEAKLQALADDNYVIGAIGDYIDALEDAGIEPEDPPALMEGTWQPQSTDGTHLWMGGGALWFKDERDNFVRTMGNVAHRELLAAQTIAEEANLPDMGRLDEAWRLLALGQVTDASGINPFKGEIEYGISHFAEVMRISRDIIREAKLEMDRSNTSQAIATKTGQVYDANPPIDPEAVEEGPVVPEIIAPDREITTNWYQISADPPTYKMEVLFSAKEEWAPDNTLQIYFPGADGPIQVTPALTENNLVAYYREDYVFEHFYLPLANGLIGLGDDLFLIKDNAFVHLAAQVFTESPDIWFRDETAKHYEAYKWVFYFLEGTPTQAVDFAQGINIYPTLYR